MRAVVQRVRRASVEVAGEIVGAIEGGLLVLLGASKDDEEKDVEYLAAKVAGLRIFSDGAGKMNRSLLDTGGGMLVVSQFTLLGDVRRGLRPSFDDAMEPVRAEAMCDRFVALARARGLTVATGRFRADMLVSLENDGPVTILLDSAKLF